MIEGNPRWDKVIHPEDLEEIIKSGDADRLRSSGGVSIDHEYRIIRKDGDIRWVQEINQNICNDFGEPLFVQGVIIDITERKNAEIALLESERRFKDVASNSGDWIWETDAERKFIFSSSIVEEILGYKPEEMVGKYSYEILTPEEQDKWSKPVRDMFHKHESFKNVISKKIHKDGRIIICESSGVPIIDNNGNLLG